MTWSQTYTGKKFDHKNPWDHEYDVVDIAHHLALVNRYGGAATHPYSVAQHSVHLAEWLWATTGDPYVALDGLMHDAAEAYIGDIRGPLKPLLSDFRWHEYEVDLALRYWFRANGLLQHQTKECKEADKRICLDEKAAILRPCEFEWDAFAGVEPLGIHIPHMPWHAAEKKFLETWEHLQRVIDARERGPQLAGDLSDRA